MPVTLAHPAAVVGLRATGLPMSAMVIGAMAPDLPVLSRWYALYPVSHSLLGILTVDLAITFALLLAWDRWIRDALVDTAPAVVRDRLPAHVRLDRRGWLLAAPAAVLGAATHVLWDSFTHQGRWGVQQVAWLTDQQGRITGAQWAQYASSLLGLAIVTVAIVQHLRRSPIRDAGRPRRLPSVVLPLACGAAALVGFVVGLTALDGGERYAVFWAAVSGIIGLIVAIVGVSAAWQLSGPVETATPPAGPRTS